MGYRCIFSLITKLNTQIGDETNKNGKWGVLVISAYSRLHFDVHGYKSRFQTTGLLMLI